SLKLARCINQSFGALGLENRGVDKGDFLVIRDNTQPSVLLEMGYINTQKDFDNISDPSYRSEAMDDVVKGLKKFIENND
ncbi:MAG: N-acetylmuramoyl-L-alanine amidase, partial [Ligilactobacillus ruminis]|nr:N-acetylmuramoyl-L-alanine amidase [Ligilactobacillus ruminis]